MVQVSLVEIAHLGQFVPVENRQTVERQADHAVLRERLKRTVGVDRGQAGGVRDLLLSQREIINLAVADVRAF
jgi:hypothetical protein